MKVVILAGGFGTRISEETILRPKPMIEIGAKPIIWHIMKLYASHGFNEFIICCGYKGYQLKEYFANYFLHNSDVTFDLNSNQIEVHKKNSEDWKITLIDTGESTMTGGRIKRIREFLNHDENFLLTYGDGLSNLHIRSSVDFHLKHGKLATVTAVKPPGRYGVLTMNGQKIIGFTEKPMSKDSYINGGFFILSTKCIDLIKDDTISWEKEPMEELAKIGELIAFEHLGFWQCMDTIRDKILLEELWSKGNPPWKNWQ